MAYTWLGRESSRLSWQAGVAAVRRHYRAALGKIPSNCPLCADAAQGAELCLACAQDVVASMRGGHPRCPVCRLQLDQGGGCPDCARQAPDFHRVVAAFDYAGLGELLIGQFKAGRHFSHARFLAGMLEREVRHIGSPLPRHTILVPVPASRASIVQRGFNPAAELARYLAPCLALRRRPGLLVRSQEGGRQTHLGRTQRARQAPGLYRCTARVDGATIAVVDDVLTTGSTLNGIARQFRAAGAAEVWGLVLARTPYR
ncbi:ComF family protein [Eoetvoesiella caeni]|uniref:ComF family protein n=1 Tax=Eoetvoesiella caeni TaxID=645616 RepID=A0A366H839_9BURK|nr:phosphoribosyltransferase family protein [Eoetvoesiella caeni]MCI2809780.1 ComF family protein [Eoetvoesiella caeni]NYT56305.1 ComF family protein [Eoetvoesiella caeni]RBP38363.1 ComF family protein [Eoetvoesiella caeni]